jgi:hypothetical protein
LLRQSTANRQALAEVAQNLQPVIAWVDLGVTFARKARSALSTLAPLLSLWGSRKSESTGFLGKLAGAVSLGRSVAALWKNWR